MPNNVQPQQSQKAQTPQTKQASEKLDRGNQGKPGFENEGEGNKTAARHYNQATEEYSRSGRAEKAAEEAKRALAGAEGDALRDAEAEAKSTEPEPEREQEDEGEDEDDDERD